MAYESKLKKSLGLFEVTVYGVGLILGAGIYALLGEAAGIAGNATWLSFVIAAAVAAFTGLSYAELASAYPLAGASFAYVKRGFNSKMLAHLVGWVSVLTGITSAATVALAFGGYLDGLLPVNAVAAAIGVILVFFAVNLAGVKVSSNLNAVFTFLEVVGLVLVVLAGATFLGGVDYFSVPEAVEATADATPTEMGHVFTALLGAAVLVFFAFMGFEEMGSMAEETRDAEKIVPRALLLALAISTVLYILVALVAVSVVPWQELSTSKAPLALVMDRATGNGWGNVLAVIALFSTGNTVLITLLVASRILYGMAMEKSMPRVFSSVNKRWHTPQNALLVASAAAIGFALIGDIGKIASVVDFLLFFMFVCVNAAVILLRQRNDYAPRFRSPFSLGNVPLFPALGLLTSFFMLTRFTETVTLFDSTMPIPAFGLMLLALGIPAYWLAEDNHKENKAA